MASLRPVMSRHRAAASLLPCLFVVLSFLNSKSWVGASWLPKPNPPLRPLLRDRRLWPDDRRSAVRLAVQPSVEEQDEAWKRVWNSADPYWNLTVLSMAPWGARVRTKEGLIGVIPVNPARVGIPGHINGRSTRGLGFKADTGLVGAQVAARIQVIHSRNRDIVNPRRVWDYPIIFSYLALLKLDLAHMDLAQKFHEGDVADAKVVSVNKNSLDIEIKDVPFTLWKVDITAFNKTWEMSDRFSLGEMIKVYCSFADKNYGLLRWSTRALEEVPGEIITNKTKVFKNAEEAAKKFFKQKNEKLIQFSILKDFFGRTETEIGVRRVQSVPRTQFLDEDAAHDFALLSRHMEMLWDKAVKSFEGVADPCWNVTILSMAPWGARVRTKEGLIGMIPAQDLGSKAGDVGLVGTEVKVAIRELRPENRDYVMNPAPEYVRGYPVVFSYSRIVAQKFQEGDVADAKVVSIFPKSMDIEIDEVPFNMRKVEITGFNKTWDISDIFSLDEMIKVYCMIADKNSGDLRWSTRALEEVPGEIIRNKAKVFENAEEAAKKFFEKQQNMRQKEKNKMLAIMEGYWNLAEQFHEGDVADAKVVGVHENSLDIKIKDVLLTQRLRKVDITAYNQAWKISDIFSLDEMIKVYAYADKYMGDLRWSTRALEEVPGEIITNKTNLFENAEETAKKFFEKQQNMRQKEKNELFAVMERQWSLTKKLNDGDVADAKVVGVHENSVDINIKDVPFTLRKVDITACNKTWEVSDLFSLDEMIKVVCCTSCLSGPSFLWPCLE
ncbi:30S ribosomal protein S1 [Durusdinium trenchii]|uniref:Chloroplastic (CS1) (Chloroplastic small ribosomal subunit protein bS1c) n=1 Tax=Durusdinium trenchii TaxID=1381693 RepID=A0ABP0K073_9DINO